jgi:licheninase
MSRLSAVLVAVALWTAACGGERSSEVRRDAGHDEADSPAANLATDTGLPAPEAIPRDGEVRDVPALTDLVGPESAKNDADAIARDLATDSPSVGLDTSADTVDALPVAPEVSPPPMDVPASGIDTAVDRGPEVAGDAKETSDTTVMDVGLAAAPLMIDDFEDGDAVSLLGTNWSAYDDSSAGGKSTYSFTGGTGTDIVMGGAGYRSSRSLEFNFALAQGTNKNSPYLGFGVALPKSVDLRRYQGVSLTYKGPACQIQLQSSDVTDYAYHAFALPESKDWTTLDIPFSAFAQHVWSQAAERVPLNLANVTALAFPQAGWTVTQGTVAIDNIALAASINRVADWTIHPATPPADTPVAAGAITNPLQAQAMKTLTSGYNLASWLDAGKFDNFDTYNEAYVAKLQAAGFKALRLPIDLDLYVTATSGSGSTLDVSLAPDLWTVLDSFDQWTAAHGMSLSIDYHQGGQWFDSGNPESLQATMVVLWSKVAGHFSSNPRKDLYYELLNEPGPVITSAQWTQLATNMIAAIRAKDPTHTILFGDAPYYNIDQLAQRSPLADSNIIYVIHDYDPMVFTHQGAHWVGMSSTHDIPYPYSPARWSQFSMDLGFDPSMQSWILADAADYYKTGNRSAIRNHMVIAKNWAIQNNVPVICNEFGANYYSSDVADRANYYSDVTSVFKELQIPWQVWFTPMDAKTGVLAAAIKSALGI